MTAENFKGWHHHIESTPVTTDQLPRYAALDFSVRDHIRQVATDNGTTAPDVIRQIRIARNPNAEKEINKRYGEKISYVGCVHEVDEELIGRLNKIGDNPPDQLIFLGDLTGSPEMEEFKKYYYNYVTNRSKPILKDRPDIEAGELLGHVGNNAPEPGLDLREGYKRLYSYQLKLAGKDEQQVNEEIEALTDDQIVKGIKDASNQPYYGTWVGTLPAEVRRGVLATVESNAAKICDVMDKLRDKGVKISLLEGNWDGLKSGVNEIAGSDLPGFDTKAYFKEKGYEFFGDLASVETDRTLHIFAPYLTLELHDQIPEEKTKELEALAEEARKKGKTVIIAGHAEPNWRMHTLANPSATFDRQPKERQAAITGFNKLIAAIKPDEVVYAHQHNLMVNEAGEQVSLNAKYILEVVDGQTQLLTSDRTIGRRPNQVVASYVPLRRTAEVVVPRKYRGKAEIKGVRNGDRAPVVVFDSTK